MGILYDWVRLELIAKWCDVVVVILQTVRAPCGTSALLESTDHGKLWQFLLRFNPILEYSQALCYVTHAIVKFSFVLTIC